MSQGFTDQSNQVEVFRLQVSALSSNFDRMQVEFVESSKRQDLKFAEMKALQDAVIHQRVIESENKVDVKINLMFQKLDSKIEEIKQQQASASSTRADSHSASDFEMVGGDDGGGRRNNMRMSGPDQASATRLVVLGYEKPLLEASLKASVFDLVQNCSPLGEEPIIRAYSLTRKVILDFPNTLACSAFFGKSQTVGKVVFQNPIDGLGWNLRVRRDLPPASRKLFYYLGQSRAIIGRVLAAGGFEVGSNGLGGQVYGLLTDVHPVVLAKIVITENGEPELVLSTGGLAQFGLDAHAPCILANFGSIRPFV